MSQYATKEEGQVNDNQRLTALKKEGIVFGRTFMVTTLPQIARDRGLLD